MIYLDNAATTFPKPNVVYEEMDRINRTLAVNAGRGSYSAAQEALQIIEDTKSALSKLFNAGSEDCIVFTPSITHAFNQIIYGLELHENAIIYMSPYEHNAVARTVAYLCETTNAHFEILPTDEVGEIDIEKIKYQFSTKEPDAVFCTGISNVTGYMLPYSEVFSYAKNTNSRCVTILDAAQSAGLQNIDINKENIDILAFAGHKTLEGPFGIAGFVLSNHICLKTVFTGGTGSNSLSLNMPADAPGKYEAASQNIVAIAGLRAAIINNDQPRHFKQLKDLTNYLLQEISKIKKVRTFGIIGDQNIGIVSFNVEGYESSDVGTILDEEFDIAVRTGYHCAPFIHGILKDKQYGGTVRVGVGRFNTENDIDSLIAALKTL